MVFKAYKNAEGTDTVILLVRRLENVAAEVSALRESLRVSKAEKADLQRVLEEMKGREGDWASRIIELGDLVSGVVKEKDVKIGELEKAKERLESKNGKMMAELRQIRESYGNQEESVISTMCLDVKRDKIFASSQIGKIMSEILNKLDHKGSGAEEGGNCQEANSNTGP